MSKSNKKVIGYYSYLDQERVICSGDACIIASTDQAMLEHALIIDPTCKDSLKIRKTRFGDILKGLQAGAAYAFDQESYERFQPFAIDEGLNISDISFTDTDKLENGFLVIRLNL